MKVAILDDWLDTISKLPCFSKLKNLDVTIFTDHENDIEKLIKRLRPFDALVLFRERTLITSQLIEQLPNLKIISQRSVYPHIDVDACTRNNVLLCSKLNSDNPPFATAEHTWALILTSVRQIPQQMANMKAGLWQMGVGKTLHGKCLGLYGYGRIAKIVAKYADAFGMEVIWWASKQGRSRAIADGLVVAASRQEFFSKPDIISLHVRLKTETAGLIKFQDLNLMRDGSLFVNTSRAGLIEEGAILKYLNSGKNKFAALDVFDSEPIKEPNDPLVSHPNIICTPHIGFVTEEEFELQFSDIFDQILAYQTGKPINVINPSALRDLNNG